MFRRLRFLLPALLFIIMSYSICEADDQAGDQSSDDIKKRIEALEAQVKALQAELDKTKEREFVSTLPWEPGREAAYPGDGVSLAVHGYFRGRALIEANTRNRYTNDAGYTMYAYDPRSTLKNDYGWWDMRLLVRTVVNFGEVADLIVSLQFGDVSWGSQSPALGGEGTAIYDRMEPFFRELYTRLRIYTLPWYLEFGRMPFSLGNSLIVGAEHTGVATYWRHKFFEAGFGGFRDYEGEPFEMKEKWNDDMDWFTVWAKATPTPSHRLDLFGYLLDLKVPSPPVIIWPGYPTRLLPGFEQNAYQGQDDKLYDVGGRYIFTHNGFSANFEFDKQFGSVKASDKAYDDIYFRGFAGMAKMDWRFGAGHRIAWTSGYGSGDDPKTTNYEGFFAPFNDFGIRDDDPDESINRGYFSVYEHLSPGAGVPGRLFDDLGTGGIENTVFTNLGYDTRALPNHHFYVSLGYIQAARKNPQTDSSIIGLENDARIEYIFNKNVTFSIYGGHLFILGDYFRKHAHDAAQLFFEWRLNF